MRYFRVVIALLASLGAFIGYACRLNLSLVIESMVEVPVTVVELAGSDRAITQRTSFAADQSNFFQTEDLTFAKLSRRIDRPKSIDKICADKIKKGRTSNIKTASYLNSSPNFRFAIDFDVQRHRVTNPEQNHPLQDTASSTDEEPIPIQDDNLMQWSETQRNDLLLSFFMGYVVLQLPSARMAETYGTKLSFTVVALGTGICSILFPIVAQIDRTTVTYVYILRVIMGFCQSSLFASTYIIIGAWMPTNERAKWLPYPATFSRLGTIVMNTVIPPVVYSLGWPYVFYLSGGTMLVWLIVFLIFGASRPSESYWISDFERHYIESNMNEKTVDGSASSATKEHPAKNVTASNFTLNEPSEKVQPARISWKKLFFNRPILMLSLVMFSAEWSNMLILIKLPGFLGPALKLSLDEISLISSVLVGIFCIHYPLCGYIASVLDASDIEFFNTLRVRKMFELLASLLQTTACLVIASSANKWVIITGFVLLTLGRATVGGGQCLLPPELSKEFSGTVLAFANTIANMAGILGPKAVNWLVERQDNYASWLPLWLLSAGIFMASGIIFAIFGDNGPQDYKKKSKKGLPTATSIAQLTLDNDPGQVYSMEVPPIKFGE